MMCYSTRKRMIQDEKPVVKLKHVFSKIVDTAKIKSTAQLKKTCYPLQKEWHPLKQERPKSAIFSYYLNHKIFRIFCLLRAITG